MKKLFIAIIAASMLMPSLALADDFTGLNTTPTATPQVYGFMDNKFYDVSGTLKYFAFMDGTLFDINGNPVSRESVGLPPLATTTPVNQVATASPVVQNSGTIGSSFGLNGDYATLVYNLTPNSTYYYRFWANQCPSDKTTKQISDIHIDNLNSTYAAIMRTGDTSSYTLQFGAGPVFSSFTPSCSIYDDPAQSKVVYTDTKAFTTPTNSPPPTALVANLNANLSRLIFGSKKPQTVTIGWDNLYPYPVQYSVEYGTSSDPSTFNALQTYVCSSNVYSGSGDFGGISPVISNLQAKTTYYYRVSGRICPSASTLPDSTVPKITSEVESFKTQ